MRILDANRSDIYIYFTRDEMETCCHIGQCDDGTNYTLKINRDIIETIPIDNARKALKTYGIDDIDIKDNDTVYQYILWIAAGDAIDRQYANEFSSKIKETGEFEGTISIY